MRRLTRFATLTATAAVAAVPLFVPVAAHAAAPSPVTRVYQTGNPDDGLHLSWMQPSDTPYAVACFGYGSAPATPAGAVACTAPTTAERASFNWNEDEPDPVGVVFSYDPATDTYGPGATDSNETPPPIEPAAASSRGVDASSLDITWDAGDFGLGGATEVVVTMAKGLTAPADDAQPVAVVSVSQPAARVTGLEPNAPYTFRVRTRDADGNYSTGSAVVTTTARDPGAFVRTAGWRTRVPGTTAGVDDAALAIDRRNGRAHLLVANGHALQYRSHGRSGDWSTAKVLTTDYWNSPAISVTGHGRGVASWENLAGRGCYRVHVRDSWSATRCLGRDYQLFDVDIDDAGHLHFVLNKYAGSRTGLYYRTNAPGNWTQYRISTGVNLSRLTIDRVRDRVVLMTNDPAGGRVAVAAKDVAATRFGQLHWHRLSRVADLATDVVASGGRVTVLVDPRRTTPSASRRPYLLAGTVSGLRGPATIRGASAAAQAPVIGLGGPRRVLVGWFRPSASYDAAVQGVWTVARVQARDGSWSFTAPAHRSTSAFDRPFAVARDADGHAYVGWRRLP